MPPHRKALQSSSSNTYKSSFGNGTSNFGGGYNNPSLQNLRSVKGSGLDLLNNNPFIKKGLSEVSSLNATTFDKPSTPVTINYNVGDKVSHIKFGDGKVTEMVKKDNDYMVTVEFDDYGIKKMKASFAKLIKG